MSIGHLQDQGLRAAREGRAICKFVDEDTVTDAFVVQTAAAIYYDIPEGKQLVIKSATVGGATVLEECVAYLVGCDAVAGGGTPTQLNHHLHIAIGDRKEGLMHAKESFDVPKVVKYSDGHRSVSLAVMATDNATVVTYGWCGWVEDEGTLS